MVQVFENGMFAGGANNTERHRQLVIGNTREENDAARRFIQE